MLLIHSLQDVLGKAVSLTRESCLQFGTRSLVPFVTGMSQLCDLLSSRAYPPHVWVCLDPNQEPRVRESLRFGFLDVQEHMETFLDRKDHVAEVSRRTALFNCHFFFV